MLQKTSTIAWMLFASLILTTIFINPFGTLGKETYAHPSSSLSSSSNSSDDRVWIRVMRGQNSGIGAVTITNFNQNKTTSCIATVRQGHWVKIGQMSFKNDDPIDIKTFFDPACKTPAAWNGNPPQEYKGLAGNLPGGCGTACKVYTLN